MPTPRDLLLGLFKREELTDFAPEQDGLSLVGSYYQSRMELGSQRHKKYKDYRDMGESATIWTALELYAEEVTQTDQVQGASIWPVARRAEIEMSLRRMLEKIGAEDQVFLIARYLAQYGDCFVRPLVAKNGSGVVGIEIIEAEDVTRVVDKHARLVGFRIAQFGDHLFDPHEIVHFRTLGKAHTIRDGGAVYGTSFLEGARRAWRISSMMEDVLVIYRLEVGGQHKVFYIDVGTATYERALNIASDYKRKFSKREYFNPNTMEWTSRFAPFNLTADVFWPIREGSNSRIEYIGVPPNVEGIADVEYFHNQLAGVLRTPKAYLGYDDYSSVKYGLCLTGDTLIHSLDGCDYPIADVVEKVNAGEDVWVYSVEQSSGKMVPGLVVAGQNSGVRKDMVEVGLDNGESIRCTSTHPFIMRDGAEVPAGELGAGDSLMPFYLKNYKGYDYVYDPAVKKDIAVNRLVSEFFDGPLPWGMEVHHAAKTSDGKFDRHDNRPMNLVRLTKADHLKLHWLEDHAARREAVLPAIRKAHAASLESEVHIEAMRENGRRYGRENLAEYNTGEKYAQARADGKVRSGRKRRMPIDMGKVLALIVDEGVRSKNEVMKRLGYSPRPLIREVSKFVGKPVCWAEFIEHFGYEPAPGSTRRGVDRYLEMRDGELVQVNADYLKRRAEGGPAVLPPDNHKVVYVKKIPPEEVYDIRVEGENNFALTAGCVVKNSQLDINFSRRGARLQRSVRRGFHALGEIHLAFTGEKPRTEDNRFLMMMVPPSMLDYEQRMEGIDMAIELSRKVVELGQAIQTDPENLSTVVKRLLVAAMPFDVGRALMMRSGSSTRLDIPERDVEDVILEHFSRSGDAAPLREIKSLYSGMQDASLISEQFALPAPEPEDDITIPSICEEYTAKRQAQLKEQMDHAEDPFIIEMTMEQFEQLKPHLNGNSRPAFTAAAPVEEAVVLDEPPGDLTEENLAWAAELVKSAKKKNGR